MGCAQALRIIPTNKKLAADAAANFLSKQGDYFGL
jgi:hypothetical protein